MSESWKLAELDDDAVELVQLAEDTLGADVILAYEPQAAGPPEVGPGLAPAPLDESRLECLQGLEEQLGVVVVAYAKSA